MVFNSIQFLWLFPIIFILYYCLCYINRKRQITWLANATLLIMSYGLYMQWNAFYAIILLWVTFVTYIGALWLTHNTIHLKKKHKCWLVVTGGVLPLLIFKYYNFSVANINNIIGSELTGLNWAIPLGISFYTFQAVGYFDDVYKGKIQPERNFFNYATFVSFFPQILSGPISRASDLLPQIKATRQFDYKQAVEGLKLLLWGMFMKVVVADRLGVFVDATYSNISESSSPTCIAACIAYSIQIYGDFAGYSSMAVGVGKLLGFDLINNFNRPYFAPSITEFWKRWHISLTRWLTAHIYISLGGNRCSKIRQYLNIMVTFLVSGFWHGANWTFIIWGILHGFFQTVEKACGLQSCNSTHPIIYLIRICLTFVLVTFAWILFRCPDFDTFSLMMHQIINGPREIFDINLGTVHPLVIWIPLITLLASEISAEFLNGKFNFMSNKHFAVRWSCYLFILLQILVFGLLDSGTFIYANF